MDLVLSLGDRFQVGLSGLGSQVVDLVLQRSRICEVELERA